MITDKVEDYYSETQDTPAGEVQINEGKDPTSFDSDETTPPTIPPTGSNATEQNQYRATLPAPPFD